MGQFVGFSDEHSSMVANVRHLTTRYISPQFHVLFDDLFETVNHTGADDRKAMKLEIATLEAIDARSVIDRLDHHVIASTWALMQTLSR